VGLNTKASPGSYTCDDASFTWWAKKT